MKQGDCVSWLTKFSSMRLHGWFVRYIDADWALVETDSGVLFNMLVVDLQPEQAAYA